MNTRVTIKNLIKYFEKKKSRTKNRLCLSLFSVFDVLNHFKSSHWRCLYLIPFQGREGKWFTDIPCSSSANTICNFDVGSSNWEKNMLKAEVKGTMKIMLDHIIVTTNKYLLSIQYKDFLSKYENQHRL